MSDKSKYPGVGVPELKADAPLAHASDHLPKNDPRSPIVLTWNQEFHAGNGTMVAGSRLTFWPNGDGKFEATTYTNHTHSGDTWHHLMYVQDAHDQFLFWVGFFDGPRMDDGNPPPRYPWERVFRFDPALYGRIYVAFVKAYDC